MPHQVHLRILGRTTDHRLAMLRNLAIAVLRYERVRTTEAKAKAVRGFVDRAIALGREDSLTARRRALALLHDRLIVEKLFADLAQRYSSRPSGYARLVRLGHRVGDGAPMMSIELVEGDEAKPEKEAVTEKEAAPRSRVARARELAKRVTGSGATKTKKTAGTEEGKTAPRRKVKEKEKSAKP